MRLAPDEAYYWDWSRHLAAGYYDQGPMVAYVIRATTSVLGNTEFGVRIGALLAALAALVSCWALARRVFGEAAGFLTVLLLGLTPLMEVGSVIATYDPLLVCFWSITLLALDHAIFDPDPRRRVRFWLWSGFGTGLGFLSKHTMLLIAPCLVLFLALSRAHRFWLARWPPYAAFTVSLLMYGGVFWWNATHHWWTFGHLLFLTAKTTESPLHRAAEFIGSQALLLGPGLFAGTLIVSAAALARWSATSRLPGARDPDLERHFFLICTGLPVFAFFIVVALRAKVQANWAPVAWLSLTVLLAGYLAQWARSARAAAVLTTGLIAGMSAIVTVLGLSPTVRAAAGIRLPARDDVSNQTVGWRALATRVDALRSRMQSTYGAPVFIAGNGYQYCALMAFYLPDHPPTYDLLLHYRLTMYAAYVGRLRSRLGQNAIFLNDGEADDHDLRMVFRRVRWLPPIPIYRRPLYTRPIRWIHVAECFDYRLYTGLSWARGG